jgi:hypothetical protein
LFVLWTLSGWLTRYVRFYLQVYLLLVIFTFEFLEEGLIRLFANRAADPDTGAGVFDSTISVSSLVSAASARIAAQTEQLFAYGQGFQQGGSSGS